MVGYYQTVTSGYFEAMRIPIVRGRAFQETDRTGAPVAIVNEAFVRTFWKGLDPIGRRVRPRFGDQTPWVTVVGVARDVKQAGIDQPAGTELYLLLDQLPHIFPTIPAARLGTVLGVGRMHIVLRSTLPAATLQPSIANAVREADPSLPIIRLRDMEDVFRGFRAPAPHVDAAPDRRSPVWRSCWRRSAPTGCSRTWSRSSGVRSGSGWRSVRSVPSCSAASWGTA